MHTLEKRKPRTSVFVPGGVAAEVVWERGSPLLCGVDEAQPHVFPRRRVREETLQRLAQGAKETCN
jgi:hypothetical protein